LGYLRFLGRIWNSEELVPPAILDYVAAQLKLDPAIITEYLQREPTRREPLVEIMILTPLVKRLMGELQPKLEIKHGF
jgi:Domain of unknown function (DUF4158)